MPKASNQVFCFDTATALNQGGREYQEDSVIADFSNGSELGFVVLADGMGGHAAGDVASKIVVTEVFTELTFLRAEMARKPDQICQALHAAAMQANQSLKEHVTDNPETKGMGATLLSTIIQNGKLNWISIGDSPLFLFRDNALVQLNEDHSMARTIDIMVETGMLSAEDGANHPDRNVITSALLGEKVPEIDCPGQPFQLQAGDTLIAASDGLQYLSNAQIEKVLKERPFNNSSEIADFLIAALQSLEDPDLDNISMSVTRVRVMPGSEAESRRPAPRPMIRPQKPSLFRKVLKSDPVHAQRPE